MVLKGQTPEAQSVLAKIARFNCKPSLSAELVLESKIKREANHQLQHFTVSDGKQEDTEGQNRDIDKESSASLSPLAVASHKEKMVKSYAYIFMYACVYVGV